MQSCNAKNFADDKSDSWAANSAKKLQNVMNSELKSLNN